MIMMLLCILFESLLVLLNMLSAVFHGLCDRLWYATVCMMNDIDETQHHMVLITANMLCP